MKSRIRAGAAADVVWNAPQFPDEGDEILRPSTQEGWVAVRNGAVALAESANLLLVAGRKAHPADKEVNMQLWYPHQQQ